MQRLFIILKTRLISMDASVAQWMHARLHDAVMSSNLTPSTLKKSS